MKTYTVTEAKQRVVDPSAAIEFHPLANCYPLLEGQALEDLVADIKAHGLVLPIELYEGMIIDGRKQNPGDIANAAVHRDWAARNVRDLEDALRLLHNLAAIYDGADARDTGSRGRLMRFVVMRPGFH
jgi:hypothetical protein